MADKNDPLDIVQQFIDKNKNAFGSIGFGGGASCKILVIP